jgi:hypothetical protein
LVGYGLFSEAGSLFSNLNPATSPSMRNAPIEVTSVPSASSGPLQATDYFLWALQRVYTKGEDRFLSLLWPRISLIVDVDDCRKSVKGRYYTRADPLTVEKIKKVPGI